MRPNPITVTAVDRADVDANGPALAQMFRARHDVFHAQLGWDVSSSDGMERDALDDADPVYLLGLDSAGGLWLSARFLPTTGPTLIEAAFADTVPRGAIEKAPGVWEWSRFCGAPGVSLRDVSAFLDGVERHMVGRGARRLIANTTGLMLAGLRRYGIEHRVLGQTARYGAPVYAISMDLPFRRLPRQAVDDASGAR